MLKNRIFIGLMCLTIGCTENPFIKNNISEDSNRVISGTVVVDDGTDNSGVFVWMESLNLSTWTDENGEFTLTIPPKPESTPGGGISGYLTVYYYIDNFVLESSQVFLFDAAFQYDKADLDAKGKIKNTIVLQKTIEVTTSVSPDNVLSSYTDTLNISALVKRMNEKIVITQTYINRAGEWGAFFIRSQANPEDITVFFDGNLREESVISTTKWEKKILFQELHLQPGIYDIIPYCNIFQNLPNGLIKAIGEGIKGVNLNYFKLPKRYSPATLTVIQ